MYTQNFCLLLHFLIHFEEIHQTDFDQRKRWFWPVKFRIKIGNFITLQTGHG